MSDPRYSCLLVGGKYTQRGIQTLRDMRLGSIVKLRRDLENKFDEWAVAVYAPSWIGGHKLGHLSRHHNQIIAKYMDLKIPMKARLMSRTTAGGYVDIVVRQDEFCCISLRTCVRENVRCCRVARS
jgi:hypothetical protein